MYTASCNHLVTIVSLCRYLTYLTYVVVVEVVAVVVVSSSSSSRSSSSLFEIVLVHVNTKFINFRCTTMYNLKSYVYNLRSPEPYKPL